MNGPRHINDFDNRNSRKKRKRNMPGNEAYLMFSLALLNGLQIYVASAISNPRGVTEANANETRDHCSFG